MYGTLHSVFHEENAYLYKKKQLIIGKLCLKSNWGKQEGVGSNQKHLYSLDNFQLDCGWRADQDNPSAGWCGY